MGINAMPKKNNIVISFGSPYHSTEYFERVGTYVNAYAINQIMQEAVTGVLSGEFPFTGVSPVNLDY